MAEKELTIPQSQLNKLTQLARNLRAGIFRSTSLFKNKKHTKQMVLEPVLKVDSETLLKAVKEVFPEERISVEQDWRRIKINIENVKFKS